jgi:hypothetical protein
MSASPWQQGNTEVMGLLRGVPLAVDINRRTAGHYQLNTYMFSSSRVPM